MVQMIRRQLGGLVLACGMASFTLATEPSDGFFSACKQKFLASDYLTKQEYSAGIFSFAMYDLVVNGGLENATYNDAKLRKAVLDGNGTSPSEQYADYLPPYAILPEDVKGIFAVIACDTYAGSSSTKVGKFCANYLDGKANATDIPNKAVIAVSGFSSSTAKRAAKAVCNTVIDNWQGINAAAIDFFLGEGLVTEESHPTSSPAFTPTSKPVKPTPTPSSTGAPTTTPTSYQGNHTFSTSSITEMKTQTQQVSGSDHKELVVVGYALGVLAVFAMLVGLFAFHRKLRERKDRVDDFSPENIKEDDLFVEDALITTSHNISSDEACYENEAFSVIPLKKHQSTVSQATNKSTGTSSIVSRESIKSAKSASESIFSQVTRGLWGGSMERKHEDIAARTVVSTEMDDIEMILGQRSFDSAQSREWKKKMKTTTPSFEENEEKSEFSPNDGVSIKGAKKIVKGPSILRGKASKLTHSGAEIEDDTINSNLVEASSFQEKGVSAEELRADAVPELETQNEIKKASSGIMSVVSCSKNEKSKTMVTKKWASAIDDVSGKTYYYNEDTQETTWIKPEGFVDEPVTKRRFSLRSKKSSDQADASEADWQVATDKFSGKPYYYNTITLQTTWTKPEGFRDADDGSNF